VDGGFGLSGRGGHRCLRFFSVGGYACVE
jgi:hypothetical protein